MTDTLENDNVQQEEQKTPENVVTLVDLQNVLVIFDLASSRGAFRGPELQPIGQLYDKINAFLQMALPKTEPTAADASGDTDAAQGDA